ASGNAPRGAIAHHLCEGVLAGDPLIAAEAAVVAAEEAVTIAALDEASDLAARALAVIGGGARDEPELRCRALLVIGDCLAWNSARDPDAARALVTEAGWLAVEHGWPQLAARTAITYLFFTRNGLADPTGAEFVRAVLDTCSDDERRPALLAM